MLLSYDHNQTVAATSWVVVHNLERTPVVQVRDSSGNVVEADVVHDSNVQATITFSLALAGRAVFT